MASFKGGAFHGNTGEHPRQEDAIGIIEESLDRNRTGTVRHFPVELVRIQGLALFNRIASREVFLYDFSGNAGLDGDGVGRFDLTRTVVAHSRILLEDFHGLDRHSGTLSRCRAAAACRQQGQGQQSGHHRSEKCSFSIT